MILPSLPEKLPSYRNLVRLHLDGVAGTISDGEIGMLATNIEELYIANMPGCNIGTGELEFLTKIKKPYLWEQFVCRGSLMLTWLRSTPTRDNYDGNGVRSDNPRSLARRQRRGQWHLSGRGRTIYGSGIQVQVRE